MSRKALALIAGFLIVGGSLLLFFGFSFNQAQGKSFVNEAAINTDNIMYHIKRLTEPQMEGRLAGTPGEGKASAYIADYFRQLGMVPGGDNQTYFQSFPVGAAQIRSSGPRSSLTASDDRSRTAVNVIGMTSGNGNTDEVILISAHFDHLGTAGGRTYPGANDNASGTAVMLELARVLAADSSGVQVPVAFVAFSGEEMGLLGSAYFAGHPPFPLERVKAVINLDSIGNGGAETPVIMWGDTELEPAVTKLAHMVGLGVKYEPQPHKHKSDHLSFPGPIRSITILSGNWLTENHTPEDTVEKLNPDYLGRVGRMVLGLAEEL